MRDLGDKTVVGVRERKKQQTRRKLIDAAIDLSERQGFDQTTVEQIVESANVSARTFARYFPTKASVILALLHDLTEAVNAELARVPIDVKPLPALLAANIGMLRRAKDKVGPMRSERIVALLRMVNTSPALQRLSIDFRAEETAEALAKRMQVRIDDPMVRLASAVWSAIIATAWGDLAATLDIDHWEAEDIPGFMRQHLLHTFAAFSELTTASSMR